MASPQQMVEKRRYFSVEEANKALPLVRAIMEDIVRQNREVEQLQERIASVQRDRRRHPREDLYAEELSQTQEELEQKEEELRGYITELQNLGVEFKGFNGLCDFYSLVNGREVYLCWRLGEPEILFWHDLESGFQGRQSINTLAAANLGDVASECSAPQEDHH